MSPILIVLAKFVLGGIALAIFFYFAITLSTNKIVKKIVNMLLVIIIIVAVLIVVRSYYT